MNRLGIRIKTLRKQHGYSQKELAAAIDTPASQVSRWESGKIKPELASIERICDALGIDVRDILLDEEVEEGAENKKKPSQLFAEGLFSRMTEAQRHHIIKLSLAMLEELDKEAASNKA